MVLSVYFFVPTTSNDTVYLFINLSGWFIYIAIFEFKIEITFDYIIP